MSKLKIVSLTLAAIVVLPIVAFVMIFEYGLLVESARYVIHNGLPPAPWSKVHYSN